MAVRLTCRWTDCYTFVSYLYDSEAGVDLTAIHLSLICMTVRLGWGGGVEIYVSAVLYVFGQQLHCHSRIGVGLNLNMEMGLAIIALRGSFQALVLAT